MIQLKGLRGLEKEGCSSAFRVINKKKCTAEIGISFKSMTGVYKTVKLRDLDLNDVEGKVLGA